MCGLACTAGPPTCLTAGSPARHISQLQPGAQTPHAQSPPLTSKTCLGSRCGLTACAAGACLTPGSPGWPSRGTDSGETHRRPSDVGARISLSSRPHRKSTDDGLQALVVLATSLLKCAAAGGPLHSHMSFRAFHDMTSRCGPPHPHDPSQVEQRRQLPGAGGRPWGPALGSHLGQSASLGSAGQTQASIPTAPPPRWAARAICPAFPEDAAVEHGHLQDSGGLAFLGMDT